ncbi:glycoside hydrolase family 57 protein [Thiorhodospira sibirica]|uniref:glycoside hydrolase family 57 protein n=1 Tax=Thiorhodospira sibirica TaxID=154347 RepID=UPI00022C406A|nr:glycoside hydrolase family 57 protein [Thiorhodospira sibirica]
MAAETEKLSVVLCWHMHQPYYRDLRTGDYALPWVYLHAIKDYTDMVAHLEACPDARVVVNFAPTLLEQIDDYAQQLGAFLADNTPLSDPLLAVLGGGPVPSNPQERSALAQACIKANRTHLIEPYPHYVALVDMVQWLEQAPSRFAYQADHFFTDLLTWFHLVWMGETVRREDARIQRLMDKGAAFSLEDRRELVQIIHELLSTVIGRYQCLAAKGRIELSFTPYAHPIMPLLQDLRSAHEAQPEVPLPEPAQYPGGAVRVDWHIRQGLEAFANYFDTPPVGCWPSEGGLSETTIAALAQHRIAWTATGETVLKNSLQQAQRPCPDADKDWLYQPYRLADQDTWVFFRDDGLSDAVGFKYATWHADDAVADLLSHLEHIANQAEAKGTLGQRVVSIILDGENAWEYYPANGYYFLQTLYTKLASHPRLNLTTFSDCKARLTAAPLKHLVAGSWVYGNFATWIGSADKNRGWKMLLEAKQQYDQAVAAHRLTPTQLHEATLQLAICEGSDWCWWFGDYNPATAVSDFERLYRLHLTNLYHLIEVTPPTYLTQRFTHGGGAPATGGTMRQGQADKESEP